MLPSVFYNLSAEDGLSKEFIFENTHVLKTNISPVAGCAACCCSREVDGLCWV